MSGKGRRSAALPKDFKVTHAIPEGMTVSLQGLERTFGRLFGADMRKRAGMEVFDEDAFYRERAAARAAREAETE